MKRRARQGKKRTVGARETVSIPEWGLHGLVARIDTGAYTSSIDVLDVVVLPPEEGKPTLALIKFGHGPEDERTATTRVIAFRNVRNPSGHVSMRPIVQAVISLRGKRFRTAINLHRRVGMTHRMIIGRRALAGRFVVDVDLRRSK